MRSFFARRPSPAMGVAFVALLAALSGTAIALPGTNSVDSGDIINGTIRGKDIHKNAVTSKKVKNGSLKSADVRDNSLTGADVLDDSLTGADLNESTLGQVPSADTANSANTATSATTANGVAANGVDTAAIQDGAVTSPKLGDSSVTASKLANTTDGITTVSVPATSSLDVTATCPAGGQALSGGWFTPATGVVIVTRSRRNTDNTWVFSFRNNAATAQGVDARVTCLVG